MYAQQMMAQPGMSMEMMQQMQLQRQAQHWAQMQMGGGHYNNVMQMQSSKVQIPQEMSEEQPMYVNAKQYRRIIKRRQVRAKLDQLRKVPSSRKPFLHKSRHEHACRRQRGPSGRFLTKAEVEALKQAQQDVPKEETAAA